MATIQACLPDYEMGILKKLKEYYESKVDEEFRGHTFNWDFNRGHRKMIRRPKVNDTFVVKEAIKLLWYETEERIEFERKEKERNAPHYVIRETKDPNKPSVMEGRKEPSSKPWKNKPSVVEEKKPWRK